MHHNEHTPHGDSPGGDEDIFGRQPPDALDVRRVVGQNRHTFVVSGRFVVLPDNGKKKSQNTPRETDRPNMDKKWYRNDYVFDSIRFLSSPLDSVRLHSIRFYSTRTSNCFQSCPSSDKMIHSAREVLKTSIRPPKF